MRCSRPTYLVVVFMGVRRDDGVWLLGTACHFIGPMMLLMEYLRRSESCCLPSIGHSVGRMGAAWAGGAGCSRGGGMVRLLYLRVMFKITKFKCKIDQKILDNNLVAIVLIKPICAYVSITFCVFSRILFDGLLCT